MALSFFGRLCRSVRGVAALLLALGVVLLAGALLLGAVTSLAWGNPVQTFSPQLLLLLDPALSDVQVDAFFLSVRQWPEVRTPRYARDARSLALPASVTVPPNTRGILLALHDDASVQAVVQTAATHPEVAQAIPLQVRASANVWQQVQALRPALLSAFVVALLASFFALTGGVRRLTGQWRGELELLRLAGVSRKNIASAFAGVGVLASGVAAALAAVAVYAGALWAQDHRDWALRYLPHALDQERMVGLAFVALIAGLLVGVLAGAWGARLRDPN